MVAGIRIAVVKEMRSGNIVKEMRSGNILSSF